jgi:hypothetical protein
VRDLQAKGDENNSATIFVHETNPQEEEDFMSQCSFIKLFSGEDYLLK